MNATIRISHVMLCYHGPLAAALCQCPTTQRPSVVITTDLLRRNLSICMVSCARTVPFFPRLLHVLQPNSSHKLYAVHIAAAPFHAKAFVFSLKISAFDGTHGTHTLSPSNTRSVQSYFQTFLPSPLGTFACESHIRHL